MICPKCQTKNDEDAKFCKGCGNSLETNKELYVYSDKNNPIKTFESTISPQMIVDTINEDESFSFDDWLDELSIDNKWKYVLQKTHDVVVCIGKKLVPIGQFIIKIIATIANEFSGTITGAVMGGIIGLLFSMIPIVGWVLGPIVTSTFAFAGAIAGFLKDIFNKLPVETREGLTRSAVAIGHAYGL